MIIHRLTVPSAPRMRADTCRLAVFGLSMPKHGFKRKKRHFLSEHAYSCLLGSPKPAPASPVSGDGVLPSDDEQAESEHMDAMKGKTPRLDGTEAQVLEQSPTPGLVGDTSLSEGVAAPQSDEHTVDMMDVASSSPSGPSPSSATSAPAVGPVGNTDQNTEGTSGDNETTTSSSSSNTTTASSSSGTTTTTTSSSTSANTHGCCCSTPSVAEKTAEGRAPSSPALRDACPLNTNSNFKTFSKESW
ncbi:polysialoglycoprotein-like isoform X3 [Eriocheir sinensis]|uniref:polysialoglycoprotein-like isoform X3 n=1 Tax=Eriocheir sinensis TaxID=95602 RepID=UPI0021C9E33A|nr:polysialoglycoprotein-like isoform X3 [Eriocheir sinensis]